jgi:hypothetical protein
MISACPHRADRRLRNAGHRGRDPANWFWFEGNFASYEANKIERLGPEAARPHRVTHRKLTRD